MPLALGLVTLVPLTVFVAQQTGIAIAEGDAPRGSPFTFVPGFLWFLWYLLIVDGAAVAAYLLAPRFLRASGEGLRALIARPLGGIFLLAVPTALALWPAATWTAAPAGDTFVPEPAVLAYYALFFGFGATLFVHRELVEAAGRNAWRWAACALATTLPAALLFALHNSAVYGSQPGVRAVGLLVYALATWTSLVALVGLAERYLSRPRPALRYVADSSYWIYLSHMPALVLVVALLGATSLSVAPQFALVTAGAIAFSLLTYPLLVRYTLVGQVLNGRRRRSRRPWPLASRPALKDVSG